MLKWRADANPGPRRAVLSVGAAMLCSGLMAALVLMAGSGALRQRGHRLASRRGRITELVIDGAADVAGGAVSLAPATSW